MWTQFKFHSKCKNIKLRCIDICIVKCDFLKCLNKLTMWNKLLIWWCVQYTHTHTHALHMCFFTHNTQCYYLSLHTTNGHANSQCCILHSKWRKHFDYIFFLPKPSSFFLNANVVHLHILHLFANKTFSFIQLKRLLFCSVQCIALLLLVVAYA